MTTLHMGRDSGTSKAVRLIGSKAGSGCTVDRVVAALSTLLDAVDLLTRDKSLNLDSRAVLESVAQLGLRLIPAAACAIYVREPHQAGLRLSAVSPSPSLLPPICPETLLRASPRSRAGVVQIGAKPEAHHALATLDADKTGAILAAPVLLNAARDGMLLFLNHRARQFAAEDLTLAERLAQTVGLVLRSRRLHDQANERTRPEVFLWETLDPIGAADTARTLAHARRLGHDLLNPHFVIVANAATETVAGQLHQNILRGARNGLADLIGRSVIAIVPVRQLSGLATEGLSVGVSRPYTDLGRYPAAYCEAQEAVEIGTRLFGPGRITHIEDLESYRFIPTFIKGGLTENLEYQMMSRLPDDLLKTLEVYLDSGGNATRAAKQLFVHRNTLRQRLDRISALINVDLTASERWLPLQLAVKAARLERLTPSAGIDVIEDRSALADAPGAHLEPAVGSPLPLSL